MDLVIRDCREGDVQRMGWCRSEGQRREWLAQYERAQRGEVDYLVAELDGEVVGKAVLDWTHQEDGTPWLWMGSVDPLHRSKGIGAAALAEAEQRAAARGATALEMSVDDDNPRALALYLRSGYAAAGPHVDEHDETDDAGNITRVRKPGQRLRKSL